MLGWKGSSRGDVYKTHKLQNKPARRGLPTPGTDSGGERHDGQTPGCLRGNRQTHHTCCSLPPSPRGAHITAGHHRLPADMTRLGLEAGAQRLKSE